MHHSPKLLLASMSAFAASSADAVWTWPLKQALLSGVWPGEVEGGGMMRGGDEYELLHYWKCG